MTMSTEDDLLSKTINHGAAWGNGSVKNASLEINICIDPPINSSSNSTEGRCMLDSENPKRKKKKRQKGSHDSGSDHFRGSSAISCTHTETDSCLASEVDAYMKEDLEKIQLPESSSSQKKRKLKMQKESKMQEQRAQNINDRVQISPEPAEMALVKIGQDDSIPPQVTDSLDDDTQLSELGLLKQKRKKKKQKKERPCNDKQCGLPELDLIKTGDKILNSEKQVTSVKYDTSVPELQNKIEKKATRRKEKPTQKSNALTVGDKYDCPPKCAEFSVKEIGENSLIYEKQSRSPSASTQLSELNHKHNRIETNEKHYLPIEVAGSDLMTSNEKILASENRSAPSSARTGVVKTDIVNDSQNVMLPTKSEAFKASSRQEISINHHRNSGKLSTFVEGTIESFVVAAKTSLRHPNEADSFKVSENNLERVTDPQQTESLKVLENVLVDEATANCLNSNQTHGNSKKSETESGCCMENIPQETLASPQRPFVSSLDKKLLILDVNGLLADIVSHVLDGFTADTIVSRKSVFKRPFCDDFLQFCFEKFDVGVWSSRTKRNVEKVIEFLMGDRRHQLLFCWDQYHCTDTGVATLENRDKPLLLKELKKLWKDLEYEIPSIKGKYDASNTILLDDSPCKAIRNPPHTAIFPYSYHYNNVEDLSLGPGGDLRVYLEKLSEAQNVQEFIARNPFGQRPITESNSSWRFYRRFL